MPPPSRAQTPATAFGEAWKNAWVRLELERRSFAGKASVIGVRTGLIAGGVLPMSVFTGNEFLGNGSYPRRAFGWSRWLGVTLAIVATVFILTYDL